MNYKSNPGFFSISALFACVFASLGHAGITIQENITPAATYPEPVEIFTDPANAGSSGVTLNPTSMLGQTITPLRDMTLSSIYFAYSTTAASTTNSFAVHIQEVPEGNNVAGYAAGPNLLSTTSFSFGLANTAGATKLLKLAFTGADQIPLRAGVTYAIEISSNASTLALYRRGSDSYWGGQLYKNRSLYLVSGTGVRDSVMAVAGNLNVVTLDEGILPSSIWPEPSAISVANPTVLTTGVSASSGTIVSQTITPDSTIKLDTLYLNYSCSVAGSFTLKVQEVAGGASVQTYAAGTNLLGGSTPPTIPVASTGGAVRMMRIGFGGTNQITLNKGTTYAIEIASTGSALTFYRGGSSTYPGGALYVNRSAFNHPSTRDVTMSVIANINAGYTYLPIPQSFSNQIIPQAGSTTELSQDAAAGFRWARKGIYWNSVETTVGVYNFASFDPLVARCATHGIMPWFTLYGGNALYGEGPQSVLTSAGRAGFAEFARQTALHYPQIKNYEVWNEPNIGAWDPQPSVEPYCALVAAVAPAIKSVTPDAKIIGPALNVVRIKWLEDAFRLGLLEHIDYLSIHPYRSTGPETVLPEYADVRALIRRYAPPGKRIEIITGECGYSSTSQVTAAVQAQYIARMFLVSLSSGMPLTSWYTWKDGTEGFGIVDNNLQPKPSYHAIQTLSTVLEGYTFQESLPSLDPSVYMLKFTNAAGAAAYAAWTTGANVSVTLPIGSGSGSLVDLFGVSQSLSWGGTGAPLTLTQSPQYLLTAPSTTEVILDNTSTTGVTITGAWTASTSTSGYYGSNYIHDGNTGRGTKSVQFEPALPSSGTYQVYLRWTTGANRATNVPVEIISATGTSTTSVNQQNDNGVWVLVGTHQFNTGGPASVTISNTGVNGYVIVDAVRFVKQ